MRQVAPYHTDSPADIPDTRYVYSTEDEAVHLRTYWPMVFKHRWLVALVFLLVIALGYCQTSSLAPLYTASALLKIEPEGPVAVPAHENSNADTDPAASFMTQCALLKSRPLAARIVTELGLES